MGEPAPRCRTNSLSPARRETIDPWRCFCCNDGVLLPATRTRCRAGSTNKTPTTPRSKQQQQPPASSAWLAANPSKRWAEVLYLAYSPFWIGWALCVLVPFQLYEVCVCQELCVRLCVPCCSGRRIDVTCARRHPIHPSDLLHPAATSMVAP